MENIARAAHLGVLDKTHFHFLMLPTHGHLDVRNAANYTLSNPIGMLFFLQRGPVEVLYVVRPSV